VRRLRVRGADGIGSVKGVAGAAVDLDSRLARVRLDACCTPLQALTTALANAYNACFRPNLAFALPDTLSGERLTKLLQALRNTKGGRSVRPESSARLILVSLSADERTMLSDLLASPKAVGVTLTQPKDRSEVEILNISHTEKVIFKT